MTHNDAGRADEPRVPARVDDTIAERSKAATVGASLGALSAVPVIGPVMAGLLTAFVPNAKLDRAVSFVNELAIELAYREAEFDAVYLRQDEFAAGVEDILDRVVKRKNDAKLHYFAAALKTSATRARPTSFDRDRFVDLLDDLRPSHLAILAGIARGIPALPAEPPYTVGAAAFRARAVATSNAGSDDVDQDIRDLEVRGLLHRMDDGLTMMHVARDIRALLTPLGARFVEFASLAGPSAGKKVAKRRGRNHTGT